MAAGRCSALVHKSASRGYNRREGDEAEPNAREQIDPGQQIPESAAKCWRSPCALAERDPGDDQSEGRQAVWFHVKRRGMRSKGTWRPGVKEHISNTPGAEANCQSVRKGCREEGTQVFNRLLETRTAAHPVNDERTPALLCTKVCSFHVKHPTRSAAAPIVPNGKIACRRPRGREGAPHTRNKTQRKVLQRSIVEKRGWRPAPFQARAAVT